MTKSLQFAVRGLLLGGLALAASQANAQLKVGANPTTVKKSAILELESDRQGLLLTRITDTTKINGLIGADPTVDGMIIYLNYGNANDGLYVRTHGYWSRMANGGQSWDILGNATVPAGAFAGTKTAGVPFILKGGNYEGIRIVDGIPTLSNGAILNDGATVNGAAVLKNTLDVTEGTTLNGGLTLKNLTADAAAVRGLFLDQTTGAVNYRDFGAMAFLDGIKINAQTGTDFTIDAPATADYKFTTTGGHIQLTIPTQDGTINAGLLSKADWNKLSANAKSLIVNALGTAASNEGLVIDDTDPATRKIYLTPADVSHPGAVSADAQTFGGDKTFSNVLTAGAGITVTAGGINVTGDGTFNGDINMKGATATGTFTNAIVTNTATFQKDVSMTGILVGQPTDYTVLMLGTGNKVVKKTLDPTLFTPLVFATDHTGTDLAVTKDDATNKVTISVPVADATTTNGLLSNAQQAITGQKDFSKGITVAEKATIGSTTLGASTLTVNGSFAAKIRKVTSTGNIAADDYTIIASAAQVITLTLPKADASTTGRIYVIKKVPSSTDQYSDAETIVSAAAGEKIENGNAITLSTAWTSITVQSDGTQWYVIKN